jgi:hypothetical protein
MRKKQTRYYYGSLGLKRLVGSPNIIVVGMFGPALQVTFDQNKLKLSLAYTPAGPGMRLYACHK